MRISTKLLLIICTILLGYLITTAVGFYLGALNEQYLTFSAQELLPAVIKSQSAQGAFDQQKKAYESYFLYGEQSYLDTAKLQRAQIQTMLGDIVAKKTLDDVQQKDIEAFLFRHNAWSKKAHEVYLAAGSDLFAVDATLEGQFKAISIAQQDLTEHLARVADTLTQTLIDGNARIIKKTRLNRYSGLGLFVILTFFVSFSALIVIRRIVGPIQELARVSRSIASGNLEKRATIKNTDETGELARAFNKMAQQLQETLEQLRAEIIEKEKAEQEVRKINEELEQRVRERTRELEEAQKELVENAHKAGMADIAAGTLHNIGNILNSVQVSSEIINENASQSPITSMIRAGDLIRDRQENLESFVSQDPKAAKLLLYYLKLEDQFLKNYEEIKQNALRLEEKINAISDVIAAQQSYAGSAAFSEKLDPRVIIDDALTLHANALDRHGITVSRDYQEVPEIYLQKSKFLHVMINLIKNAKEAMANQTDEKVINVSVKPDTDKIVIAVSDTGEGIIAEHIDKIFTHGFTTKPQGHGFGLHSCGNYMMEMKGSIDVASPGTGQGATFTLTLPMATAAPV